VRGNREARKNRESAVNESRKAGEVVVVVVVHVLK